MMSAILLIEDNAVIMDSNREYLEMQGYEVCAAFTIRGGLEILESRRIDLIILDIMLPDGSGIDFCAKMRESFNIPVLFLTCLDDDDALIAGLKAGGDEYMTKPYSLAALSARTDALLRRVRIERSSERSFSIGPLTIDCGKRRVYLDGGDALLTPKEFDVLLMLARDMGRGFTSEEIYSRVWGDELFDSRTVIVHISSIRKKLRMDDESPLTIATEKRKYYSLRRE
ncbi:MAG: response regulator transcription factor [Oscillospiraceae bacterium]|nr:response regulator transcription factor [Oscillospiraceae bacterium]